MRYRLTGILALLVTLVISGCSGGGAIVVFEGAVVPTRTAPEAITSAPQATPAANVTPLEVTAGFVFPVADATPLEIGDSLAGTIDATNYAQRFTFEGRTGETLDITMTQQDGTLDAYLILLAPSGAEIARNDDDSANNTNARLNQIRLDEDGTYTVVATRWRQRFGDSTGDFTLEVNDSDNDGTPTTTTQRISYDVAVTDTLNDTTPSRTYSFAGEQGDIIQVMVNTQDEELDPSVALHDSGGNEIAFNEDINAIRNYDAAISDFTLPYTGYYTVVVNRYAETSGEYRLQITQTDTSTEPVAYAYLDHRQSRTLLAEIDIILQTGFYVGDLYREDIAADTLAQTILTAYLPPTSGEIEQATLNLSTCDEQGFGFESVEQVQVYRETIGELSGITNETPDTSAVLIATLEECGTVDITAVLRDAYAANDAYIQFRITPQNTASNEQSDTVVFLNPTITLQLTDEN
jgi:hypothetical protein